MADKKISELDEVTTLAAGDYLVVVQGGVTKKIKIENIPIMMKSPDTAVWTQIIDNDGMTSATKPT